ncbi:MAG: universal stress protein [Calditrichia bacterium]
MFKKILVAIDGSDLSLEGLRRALKMAEAGEAKLYVLYVIDQRVFFLPHDIEGLQPENPYFKILEDLRKNGEELMKKARQIAQRKKMEFEGIIREGAVVEVIETTAAELKTDLIVVGAHGASAKEKALAGSTAQKLITNAPCSVLVVRK